MDDTSNIIRSIGKIFNLLSHGLEAMAERANEIVSSMKEKEEKKGETPITETQEIHEGKTIEEQPAPEKAKETQTAKESAPKSQKKSKSKKDLKVKKGKNKEKETLAITKTDRVLKIINESDDPISTTSLEEMTGFGHRSVLDVVHKLKKLGKIKSVSRGVYKKI